MRVARAHACIPLYRDRVRATLPGEHACARVCACPCVPPIPCMPTGAGWGSRSPPLPFRAGFISPARLPQPAVPLLPSRT